MNGYLTRKETLNGPRNYWQDNTIVMAADMFNGITKPAGHHAHPARMLIDNYCHGRNREKNSQLSEDERTTESACYVCGATVSQSHVFRSCRHDNVAAIKNQTNNALQDLMTQFKN